MENKLLILATFHRFVSEGEGKPERKERFVVGQTVAVSDADAEDWISKGLAEYAE